MSFVAFVQFCKKDDNSPLFVKNGGVLPNRWYILCRSLELEKHLSSNRMDIYFAGFQDDNDEMVMVLPKDVFEFCNEDEAFQVTHHFISEYSDHRQLESDTLKIHVVDREFAEKQMSRKCNFLIDF